jgi:hypothetical protein
MTTAIAISPMMRNVLSVATIPPAAVLRRVVVHGTLAALAAR